MKLLCELNDGVSGNADTRVGASPLEIPSELTLALLFQVSRACSIRRSQLVPRFFTRDRSQHPYLAPRSRVNSIVEPRDAGTTLRRQNIWFLSRFRDSIQGAYR